tara:strand:+ start:8811 stop:9635 length:825 start_codon:yes stop_codon:yes gene_type:complete
MAKTKKIQSTVEIPLVEIPVIVKEEKKHPRDIWVIKDRVYWVTGAHHPLTLTIPSKHTKKHPLLWFDKKTGEQRELRYATNQNSPFVDEQKGEVTLGHITFRDGSLMVSKEKQNLQKLLSLYHPMNEGRYKEKDDVAIAVDELIDVYLEIDALIAAKEMDIDHAEAVLRVEKGNVVSEMSSKEIKRDLLLMAKKNPKTFIALANDDNVVLRNFAVIAVERGIIKISPDQRTFHWGSNDRKLMTVPFDENPYSAFASFLKTDEGVDIYRSIEKNL